MASLTVLCLAAGCRTAADLSLIDPSQPGWHIQQGQALWKPDKHAAELGGELLLAGHADGRSLVQFAKTPFTLVLAQTTMTNWVIQFPARAKILAGQRKPPTRFIWLHLRSALAGEALPAGLSFQRQPDGHWRLENARTGERAEGFLGP